MKVFAIIVFLVGLASMGPVHASTQAQVPDVDKIAAEQTQIRAELEAGHYRNLSQAERGEILERQDRLMSLIRQTEQWSDQARSELLTDVGWIQATLEQATRTRMICTRERRIGSQRVERVCRSEEQVSSIARDPGGLPHLPDQMKRCSDAGSATACRPA